MCRFCVKTDFSRNLIEVIGDGEILVKFPYYSYHEWIGLLDLANELVKQLRQGLITKEEMLIQYKLKGI